uniref:Dihydropteroate synthase n=1 Tax=Desulfobacca acetoxidans TaxID=60893 RepID=A0A7V6A3Z5_9BACT
MIIAADNLTGADPVVAQALKDLDPGPIQDLAVRCARNRAHLLDLNPGYLSRRFEDRMAFLVEAVQEVTTLPLILDSPNSRVLAGGLAVCREKPILNAVTLEEEKLAEILPLAAAHQTRLVLLLLDEKSHPPPTLEGKVAVAMELRERALAAGLTDEQLIFDPVLPNLRWPDAWAQISADFNTVRYLASGSLFGVGVDAMVGLSNLRSGLREMYPVQLEITVLALLAGAGLSLALVDILNPVVREQLQLLDQIMGPF